MWISFHSYKGGTGKTNISGNLACYLTKNGHKVGLVETDVSGPGINALFSLNIKRTLVDFLQGKAGLEEIVYRHEKSELYIIPSDATEEDIVGFSKDPSQAKEKLQSLIKDFQSRYGLDHVIFDCSPGLNRSSLLVMGMSEMSIVVSTLDKQDIRGTYVISGVARRLRSNPRILFNKLPKDKYEATKETLEDLSRKIGLEPIGVIFFDESMANAWSRKIIVEEYPKSQYGKQIAGLWERITQSAGSL
ncbi:MAG: MinD/ParA family protein [Candidatus Methanoperedens sp.]|nr:MinD/ParA family protein [Candidatus Methanoperedens sp.]